MDDQQQPRRWLTRKRVLWTVCIISVIVGGYFVLRFAYVREWKWMGLVEDPDYHKRTLWDWLNLLVVPAVLALGGYLFTRSENRRTREDADQQRTLDRQLADQRRQDDMLQAYLDGMSELLSDEKRPLHRAELGDRLSTVARARTLTVLSRLDGERKGNVVQFLYESGLIFGRRPVLTLRDANLRGANLIGADLRKADLRVTNLSDADLSHASLDDADLSDADLRVTDLYKADLRRANLPCAFLIGDDLRHAYLRNADLYYANLSGASSTRPTWKVPHW